MYRSVASTMIGPTVTAPRKAIQPLVKPIKLPNAYRGNRALPPATGIHAAELRMSQGEEHHRAAAKHPGDDGGRPGERGGVQGAKQPAGADDRPQ